MPNLTIDSPAAYGLYALAVKHPALFAEAERFGGGMLANDQDAARRVKALLGTPLGPKPPEVGRE